MTEKAKALGLNPGWYQGNCHCSDHRCSGDECYAGDVQATLDFGFESIKIDSCSVDKNVQKMSDLINSTSESPILIENCHNGAPSRDKSGEVQCPMNLFRTSGDIRPTFGSILGNLDSVDRYNKDGLTGPGCWAYPDMLEVGVTAPQPPGAKHHCQSATDPCQMNVTEWQSHFGAWCIVSSPLILGLDLTDQATLDLAWPVLTNTEAIEVNQLWSGDSGRMHSQSSESSPLPNCGSGSPCTKRSWKVWSKALPSQQGNRAAVLLMNNGNATSTVSVDLATVYGLDACDGEYHVRDIWAKVDAPSVQQNLSSLLEPHASAFYSVSCLSPTPSPAPSPSPSSDCLSSGVRYDSHKAGNVNLLDNYRQAASGEDCQAICQQESGCVCFTHRISTGHCWLMTACETPENDDKYISGPAACPPAEAFRVLSV
jgi:hypothetical protein